jgi:hypothetical protein
MPTLPDFRFCGPSFSDISPFFDSEDSLNLYPEQGLGGASVSAIELVGTPGLTLFATLPTSPVRAVWAGTGRLFAVGGTHVYEVSSAGAIMTDFGAMAGSGGGTTPCRFESNGDQLLVMDPTVGSLGGGLTGAVFYVNPAGSMDLVFNGGSLSYMDGFMFSLGTDVNSKLNVSDLGLGGAAVDWNALNFVVTTGDASLAIWTEVLNGKLWVFKEKAIEIWSNAGNPTFPLARDPGATLNQGLLAQQSVVKFSNTLMWLGADQQGYAQVFMANGLQPVRVSNVAVENFINNKIKTLGFAARSSTAFGYEEAGHTFYCLTIGTFTLVYDLTTNMWHRRCYSTDGATELRYLPQVAACAPFFNPTGGGYNYVGDYSSGRIYVMQLSATSDMETAVLRYRVSPTIYDRGLWLKHPSLEIFADVGTAQLTLTYSNNGGSTFPLPTTPVAISGTNDQGATGTFKRFKWRELGRSRARCYKVSCYDATNPIRLIQGNARVERGIET